jgi:hypothetical protein
VVIVQDNTEGFIHNYACAQNYGDFGGLSGFAP